MQRRIFYVISAVGMLFVLLPLSTVLAERNLVVACVGMAFFLLGVFSAIEIVARKSGQ